MLVVEVLSTDTLQLPSGNAKNKQKRATYNSK